MACNMADYCTAITALFMCGVRPRAEWQVLMAGRRLSSRASHLQRRHYGALQGGGGPGAQAGTREASWGVSPGHGPRATLQPEAIQLYRPSL
jgi:hypothetical protein